MFAGGQTNIQNQRSGSQFIHTFSNDIFAINSEQQKGATVRAVLRDCLTSLKCALESDMLFEMFCDALDMSGEHERVRHNRAERVKTIIDLWCMQNPNATLYSFVTRLRNAGLNSAADIVCGKKQHDVGQTSIFKTNPYLADCLLRDQEKIRLYLSRHAPEAERGRFKDPNIFHSVQDVLQKCADRMLTVAVVADAIDYGAGKKPIADDLRAGKYGDGYAGVTCDPVRDRAPLATALQQAKQKGSVGEFVLGVKTREEVDLYADICKAANRKELWLLLLRRFNMLADSLVQRQVEDLKRRWAANEVINPMDLVLKQLCEDPGFATLPIVCFMDTLGDIAADCQCDELITLLANWHLQCAAKESELEESNEKFFVGEMRTLLLEKQLATEQTIDALVSALAVEGWDEPEHLRSDPPTADQWKELGLKMRLVNRAIRVFATSEQ